MKKTTSVKMGSLQPLSPTQIRIRTSAATEFWKLLSKKGLIEYLGDLWSRWQDEKGYEDIKDYEKVFVASCKKKRVMAGKKVKRFSSSPFGIIFLLGKVAGAELEVKVTVSATQEKMVFGRNLK